MKQVKQCETRLTIILGVDVCKPAHFIVARDDRLNAPRRAFEMSDRCMVQQNVKRRQHQKELFLTKQYFFS